MLKTLRNRLEAWLMSKLIVAAREHLEAQHLGQRLGAYLDAQSIRDGFPSKVLEENTALWLEQVAKELRA